MLLVTIARAEGRVRELKRWTRERGRGVFGGGVVRRGLEGCENRDEEKDMRRRYGRGRRRTGEGIEETEKNETVVEDKGEWQGGKGEMVGKGVKGKEGKRPLRSRDWRNCHLNYDVICSEEHRYATIFCIYISR